MVEIAININAIIAGGTTNADTSITTDNASGGRRK
jgi:hypothetical protein